MFDSVKNLARNFLPVVPAMLASLLPFSVTSPYLSAQQNSVPEPSPAATVSLSAIGYQPPTRLDRLSEDSFSQTLDFLDPTHVLISFNQKRLFTRSPLCTPDHQDRMMHAAVIELPSGKVIRSADWYLHDRKRYLWPLGDGKFLLRKLNDLFLVDSTLEEQTLLKSPKPLLWVAVTPDGSQIIVETEKTLPAQSAEPPQSSAKPAPKYEATFLDAKTLAPRRTIVLKEITHVDGANTGYADLLHKGDIWLVRFGSTSAQRRPIVRVRSRSLPSVVYPGDNELLVGRCPSPDCDYSVTAFTIAGHRLWHQRWARGRFFPAISHNAGSSRFAIGTLQLAAAAPTTSAPLPPDDDTDVLHPDASQRDVFEQAVQVLEAASGTPVLSVRVKPADAGGQNFSLSPDGRHLALLQSSGIALYALPEAAKEEATRFAAVQTDVPDAYAVAEEDRAPQPDSSGNASAPAAAASNQTAPASDASAASAPDAPATESSSAPSAQPAQNAEEHSEPVETIRVATKAVIVDVVVTDGKGRPVKGLKPEEFHLAEDGKVQQVRYFHEFSDATALPDAAAAVPTPPKPSPNNFTNVARSRDPGAATLILLDLLNTPPGDQEYARKQLIKYLATKPPNRQVALCTLSAGGSHLRLVQGFTPDEALLVAAVHGKKSRPQEVQWRPAENATAGSVSAVGDLAQGGPTSGYQNLLGALQGMQAEQQVTDTDVRVDTTIDSLMLLARYLSGIPGRKNVVWLSGSFPVSIAASASSNNIALENRNYSDRIKTVTNLLAEAQVSMYPVDVRGLIAGGFGADSAGAMGGPTAVPDSDFSANSVTAGTSQNLTQGTQGFAQEAAERDTLLQFASATGGKAFYNTNGIGEAIGIAIEQGSNYYTLSYSPANRNFDGKFRKIKVQLEQKGFTLHYRQGYYADDSRTSSRNSDLARRVRAAAMQHGSPPSRQLLFTVKVFPLGSKKKVERVEAGLISTPAKKGTELPATIEMQHYVIDYTLPGSELQFVQSSSATYQNMLALMATTFDREGKMLTGISHVGATDLPPAVYKEKVAGGFQVHEELDIPVAASWLRIGVQDQMSTHLGTIEIPLPLPPVPEESRRAKISLPDLDPD